LHLHLFAGQELILKSTEMPGGAVLWFTGLPGAGKTTITRALHERLRNEGVSSVLLDGDVLRHGLNAGLGFSADDRHENLRRVAHVAQLFKNEGFVAIVATISPLRAHRELARSIVGQGFVEVFVNTPMDVCEARDPKGHYKLARRGELPNFTGIGSAYEAPDTADIVIPTETLPIGECVNVLHDYMERFRK
jgi:adenylylsulfate kinase